MSDAPQVSTADEIVRYFESLPQAARVELEALAARDRDYGEDVAKELAETGQTKTTRS